MINVTRECINVNLLGKNEYPSVIPEEKFVPTWWQLATLVPASMIYRKLLKYPEGREAEKTKERREEGCSGWMTLLGGEW